MEPREQAGVIVNPVEGSGAEDRVDRRGERERAEVRLDHLEAPGVGGQMEPRSSHHRGRGVHGDHPPAR